VEVVLPYFNSISKELVTDAHGYGLEVYAWTVNDEKDLSKLQQWGVDGVITDRYLDLGDLL
jgi:glycerophosphoryl diester phosphodiesterase